MNSRFISLLTFALILLFWPKKCELLFSAYTHDNLTNAHDWFKFNSKRGVHISEWRNSDYNHIFEFNVLKILHSRCCLNCVYLLPAILLTQQNQHCFSSKYCKIHWLKNKLLKSVCACNNFNFSIFIIPSIILNYKSWSVQLSLHHEKQ